MIHIDTVYEFLSLRSIFEDLYMGSMILRSLFDEFYDLYGFDEFFYEFAKFC